MLKLPDNDLDELADNFFCHLHDHDHKTCDEPTLTCIDHKEDEEDLTNTLNPLRDTSKLRKSVLGNLTVYTLNQNHLNPESLKVIDKTMLKCSQCKFNIGYKSKIFKLFSKFKMKP